MTEALAKSQDAAEADERSVSARSLLSWSPGPAARSSRSEPAMAAGRDQVNPRAGRDCVADVWSQARSTDPIEGFDAVVFYVPFSGMSRGGWRTWALPKGGRVGS